jgi:DNA-binding MarR family transcriptional regulator/GNAT superfamily N-acetyltransferase
VSGKQDEALKERGIERHSAAVREFNRYYTGVIGLLEAGYLQTPYSLTEARVIFELAQSGSPAPSPATAQAATAQAADAAALCRSLGLDAGYLSRILARFDADGLITRERSAADGRRQALTLTAAGRQAFRLLNERADTQIAQLLAAVAADERERLTAAMAEIRRILDGSPREPARSSLIVLRPPRPGELGWVVQRNGAIYAAEYGWDASYEALVARIVADYAARHDPSREAAWIAELDGAPAGCVFCVAESERTARLRLLLVEPHARGAGIGARLVAECVSFAKQAGYAELVLWTNDVLVAARRIYEKAGFKLVGASPHRSFGHDLVAQDWRLPLC